MTGENLSRARMIAEIEVTAFTNAGLEPNYSLNDWSFPEWFKFTDQQISTVHSLLSSRGLNVEVLDVIRKLMDYTTRSIDLDVLLTDMKNHLDGFWSETKDLLCVYDSSIPPFIRSLSEFREWLPVGEEPLTREQELMFLMLLPLVPSYLVRRHYESLHRFLRDRSISEARAALMLREEEKVSRLQEAEFILDNGKQSLAEGAL